MDHCGLRRLTGGIQLDMSAKYVDEKNDIQQREEHELSFSTGIMSTCSQGKVGITPGYIFQYGFGSVPKQ